MSGDHPFPTRQSTCLEISSSERSGKQVKHSYFFSGLRTLMLPDMVVLDPFLTALRADFLELASLATTAFLEDITMELMVVVDKCFFDSYFVDRVLLFCPH